MNSVRVSFVIPCYNHGVFLQEALRSISSQTFQDYEVIVVNDGSTDPATNRLLDQLAGEGLQVLKTANRGPAAARNLAISKAQGEYILPLDADDRVAPRFLEMAVAELDKDPELRVVCGRVEFFGERTGEWVLPDYTPAQILLDNMIVATSLFRCEDWRRHGGFREDMRTGWEDWDFWLSLLASGGRVKRLDEVVLYYRIRSDSRDRTLDFRQKLVLMLKMVARHRAFYLKYWRPYLVLLAKRIFQRLSYE
ncbi:MAG TPA: glycosyltransferase family A protein [Hyphomicrobiales bacterium]|nr:glycosyltransferase family A protein [Hyphomicrobiales bacterium]